MAKWDERMDIATNNRTNSRLIYRDDYQALPCRLNWVDLDFTLDGAHTILLARQSITMLHDVDELCFHGDELTTEGLKINGKPIETSHYHMDEHRLKLSHLPTEFEFEAKIRLDPERNSKLMGLYRSGGIYCTQCEAAYHCDGNCLGCCVVERCWSDRVAIIIIRA